MKKIKMFNKCIALALVVGCTTGFAHGKSTNYGESKFVKIGGKTYGLCGKRAYDTKEKFCVESEGLIFDLCSGKRYNPHKEKCEDGKVSSNTAMMIDKRDMRVYKTVTIGTQTWMAENLDYDTEDSWCYDNNPENCTKYGRLYTWDAAKQACPEGWHLPYDDEWDTLWTAVGGTGIAGKKLKSSSGWNNDGNGTDSFGFSVLPAGGRDYDGNFDYVGYYAGLWSASESDSYYAYIQYFYYDYAYVVQGSYYKDYGYSLRCLRDST